MFLTRMIAARSGQLFYERSTRLSLNLAFARLLTSPHFLESSHTHTHMLKNITVYYRMSSEVAAVAITPAKYIVEIT